jgi:hypothetical protein
MFHRKMQKAATLCNNQNIDPTGRNQKKTVMTSSRQHTYTSIQFNTQNVFLYTGMKQLCTFVYIL